MYDAGRVSRGERVSDGNANPKSFVEAHASSRDELIERFASHILHHDEVRAVFRRDLVNRNNVWMVEARSCPGFLHETALLLVIGYLRWRQHFDRDQPIQALVASPEHLAHTAGTDQGLNLIRSQLIPLFQAGLAYLCKQSCLPLPDWKIEGPVSAPSCASNDSTSWR